jgi:hypothetical protein
LKLHLQIILGTVKSADAGDADTRMDGATGRTGTTVLNPSFVESVIAANIVTVFRICVRRVVGEDVWERVAVEDPVNGPAAFEGLKNIVAAVLEPDLKDGVVFAATSPGDVDGRIPNIETAVPTVKCP